MNLEREVKLTVGPLFHLPDLSEVLDGFSAEGEGVQRFVTSYYDTQDLRLARWGCSLRYRTGDGWTVKLPATALSDTLAREEHHFEAGPGRPPAPAIDLLRGYLRQEPLSSPCGCRRSAGPPGCSTPRPGRPPRSWTTRSRSWTGVAWWRASGSSKPNSPRMPTKRSSTR